MYAAIRLAIAGNGRALRTTIMVIIAVLAVVYLSPLKTLVSDRFAHPHSNERRLSLSQEAIQSVWKSPLLGYGSTQPSAVNPNAPPVGTQGQVWQVLVAQGIPATLLFFWWFLYRFWRMRRATTLTGFWSHTLVLMAFVQAPFYDWLGAPLIIIMIAIALTARERKDAMPSLTSHPPATRELIEA
jgi:O-antigen ligase